MISLVSRMEVILDEPDITKDLLSTAFDSKNRLVMDFVTNCEIDNSLETMTDSAVITLPRKVQYKKNGQTITDIVGGPNALLKRGMKVQLFAGYEWHNSQNKKVSEVNKVFQGYISDISPKLPLRIEMQDGMYLLKQVFSTNYSKTAISLKKLMTDIVPAGTPISVPVTVNLGWIRITRSTVAYTLEHLQNEYGVTINFDFNGVLHAGLRYITEDPLQLKIQEFEFERNIIDDSDLVYHRSDDQLIQLRAISIDGKTDGKTPGSTKIEVLVGNNSGDRRTMYFYGVDLETLKTLANENLKKLKYEGFSGHFETFLQPRVIAGQAVKIINKQLPEKNGVYLVKAVTTRYGVDGGRQEIHLDRKVA